MMRIGVLGINHKSSELIFREQLAKACQLRIGYEQGIAERLGVVVLSTCNRTEIYFSDEDLPSAHSELLQMFREEIPDSFEHKLYTYFGVDCFAHLAQVTSGLDSVILAESEIQRQVKVAYEKTRRDYRLPSCIHYLFQKCLKIGKQIRSSVAIARGQVHLPEMVFQLAGCSLDQKVFFVGNSEINRKILFYVFSKGMRKISLCTRSVASARHLEEAYGVNLIDFSQLSKWKEHDLIICGTNCAEYLLLHSDLKEGEKLFPKLMLDLSVPRNVEPTLGLHPQITLMNMEEVGHLIEKKQQRDEGEIQKAVAQVRKQAEMHVNLFNLKTELKAILSCD